MASFDSSRLEVARHGSGPAVLLIHGSVLAGSVAFRHQLELAERWRLVIPNRPGFGASPPLARGDFELEGPLMAQLLGDGAHLVGHSYGAVIALYAAAARPHAVHSLALSEPGCLRVAAGMPAVDEQIRRGELLYSEGMRLQPLDFLRAFRGGVGSSHETPAALEGELLRGAELVMRERPPWEAEPPWQALRSAPFSKLVMSGGHSEVFEAVCDAVASHLGAARAVVPGRGHSVPATGAAYNARLEQFLLECASRRTAVRKSAVERKTTSSETQGP
jgi:pimeloyl-ACP methyl ester carboxylesterase